MIAGVSPENPAMYVPEHNTIFVCDDGEGDVNTCIGMFKDKLFSRQKRTALVHTVSKNVCRRDDAIDKFHFRKACLRFDNSGVLAREQELKTLASGDKDLCAIFYTSTPDATLQALQAGLISKLSAGTIRDTIQASKLYKKIRDMYNETLKRKYPDLDWFLQDFDKLNNHLLLSSLSEQLDAQLERNNYRYSKEIHAISSRSTPDAALKAHKKGLISLESAIGIKLAIEKSELYQKIRPNGWLGKTVFPLDREIVEFVRDFDMLDEYCFENTKPTKIRRRF